MITILLAVLGWKKTLAVAILIIAGGGFLFHLIRELIRDENLRIATIVVLVIAAIFLSCIWAVSQFI